MKLRELATKPSPEQFAQIASAIDPDAEVVSTRRLVGGISCRMDVLTFSAGKSGKSGRKSREVVVRQYGPWHKDDKTHPGTIEVAVLELLSENGAAAPSVILDSAATNIMGTRTVVTSYIDGKPRLTPGDLDDWAGQLVGAISKVHNIPISGKIEKLVPSLYTGLERLFTRSEPSEAIAQHPLGPQLWQAAKEMWPSIGKSESHLVHADYWPGNTLWKGDDLVAIIDWEEPRLGEPTWDIATIIQDSACFGMDIEDAAIGHHRRMSGRTLKDLDFWRMAIALGEMPDPGVWASGYQALGGDEITAAEIRANHTASVERMLDGG